MKTPKLAYEAVYAMKSLGWHETFAGAFKALYDAVQDDLKHNRPMTDMILDRATWVLTPKGPLMFYDARDRACKDGLLVKGKWKSA
jgi:hypothetical protein